MQIITRLLLFITIIAVSVLVGLAAWQAQRPDQRYVLYRYAENAASGHELAYNPDETARYVPAPLSVLPLLPGAQIDHLPDYDVLFTTLVIALTAVLLALVAVSSADQLPLFYGVLAGLVYVTGVLVFAQFYSDSHLAILLGLAALWLTQHKRYMVGGILIGLATLVRPEAVVLVALLTPSKPRRVWIGWLLPVLAYVLVALIWQLPWRLLLLTQATQPLDLLSLLGTKTPWLVLALPLMVAGWPSLPDEGRVLLTWGTLHLLITWLLLGALDALPLWLALAYLIGRGAWMLTAQRQRWIAVALIVVVLAAQIANLADAGRAQTMSDEAQIGAWIAANATPQDIIGGTDIGALAYYAHRPMIDFEGRFDIAIADGIQRGFLQTGLLRTLPNYVVKHESDEITPNWEAGLEDWFAANYQSVYQIDTLGVYQRLTTPQPLQYVRQINVAVGEHLHLIGLTQSQRAATPGDMLRFRLTWRTDPVPSPYDIELSLLDAAGQPIAKQSYPISARLWQAGTFETDYALLLTPATFSDTVMTVVVKVNDTNANAISQPVAYVRSKSSLLAATVPSTTALPVSQTFMQGEDRLKLHAVEATTAQKQLTLNLWWTASTAPQVDYRLFVHLYPQGSKTDVLAQTDGVFAFPTTSWERDDEIADQRVLDLTAIAPGDYWLGIGLYTPEAGRMTLTGDRDRAIFPVHLDANGAITLGEPLSQ